MEEELNVGQQGLTMAEYLLTVNQPDLKDRMTGEPEFDKLAQKVFTKELKLSNLNNEDFKKIQWFNNVILLFARFRIYEYAYKLIMERDLYLATTSSKNAKERMLQVTGINIHKITPLKEESMYSPKRLLKLGRRRPGEYE